MTNAERPDSPYQPPLRRRDSALRYGLVIALGFIPTFAAVPGATLSWVAFEVLLGFVALVLVMFRRRWPTTIGILTNAASSVSYAAYPSAMLATVSVSTRRRWREIVPVVLAFFVANYFQGFFVSVDASSGEPVLQSWKDYTLSAVLMLLFVGLEVAWGLYIGSRRQLVHALHQRAERLEQNQEMRAQHARDAERAQIAREMHDVLAHRISQVSMQAGAIAFRTDLDADALRRAAADLQASANAALVDLRGVLGVLRDPESGSTLDVPQPRFTDIDTLITHAQSSGLRVDAEIDIEGTSPPDNRLSGEPLPGEALPGEVLMIDDTIGRTLYRVTQECLTNARKHAPNATVTIRISGSAADGIVFRSSNPLPLARPLQAVPRSGFGLIGLAERAALVGGTLTTNESAEEFSITCQLPWQPDTKITRLDDASPANR